MKTEARPMDELRRAAEAMTDHMDGKHDNDGSICTVRDHLPPLRAALAARSEPDPDTAYVKTRHGHDGAWCALCVEHGMLARSEPGAEGLREALERAYAYAAEGTEMHDIIRDALAATPAAEPGAEGLDPETLRTEVRRLAFLTPEDWDERRGGDPIARTINAVEDIIDHMVARVGEAHAGSQSALAATPAADSRGLDVERLARALISWRGDYGLGLTDGDREDAASLAREYAALNDPEPASEYGRLLAERDRLIAEGADPDELLIPDEPS